jgi:hypothetical protein
MSARKLLLIQAFATADVLGVRPSTQPVSNKKFFLAGRVVVNKLILYFFILFININNKE